MKHLLFAFLLLAAPAQALTVIVECEDSSDPLADALSSAINSSATYMMAVGSFRGAKETEDQPVYSAERRRDVLTRFTGNSAGSDGFTSHVSTEVYVEQTCVGSACVPRTDGTPYLVFLRKWSGGWTMDLGEFGCAPHFFERPTQAMKDRAVQCLRAGGC